MNFKQFQESRKFQSREDWARFTYCGGDYDIWILNDGEFAGQFYLMIEGKDYRDFSLEALERRLYKHVW